MKPPTKTAALIKAHEKCVESFAAEAVKPFQARARWLLTQIKREIPALEEITGCNGSFWLAPSEVLIDYIHPEGNGDDIPPGGRYQDRLGDALEFANDCGDVPAVSPRCVEYLRELYELAGYCEDSRMHTLESLQETTV